VQSRFDYRAFGEEINSNVGLRTSDNQAGGVFTTLESPSKDMTTEAVTAGFYRSEYFHKDFPKIRIPTIEDLLNGKEAQMPTGSIAFKQAEKISKNEEQGALF
jgi:hypothetical protein